LFLGLSIKADKLSVGLAGLEGGLPRTISLHAPMMSLTDKVIPTGSKIVVVVTDVVDVAGFFEAVLEVEESISAK